MLESFIVTLGDLDPMTRFVFGSAIKGAVVFAAAGALALTLRRKTAAARHLVWSLAVFTALGLPVLSALLPTWELRLPAQQAAEVSAGALDSGLAGLDTSAEGLDAARSAGDSVSARIERETTRAGREPPPPRRDAALVSSGGQWPSVVPRWAWLPWLWGAGALLSFLPTGAALLSLWRLGRSARPLTGGQAQRLVEHLVGELGLLQPVRVVSSWDRVMPMTWGVWRPLILLPNGAESWTEECLKMVILHELAHVKRRDFVTQVLARMACALHWFNPLAWLASARLRAEQEQACDDLALGRGLDPSDYAGHLLAILSRGGSPGASPAVASAMASSVGVERRLRSILDPSRDRRPLARRQIILASMAVAFLLAPLATGRLGAAVAGPLDEIAVQDGPREKAAGAVVGAAADDQASVLEHLRRHYVKPPDEAAIRNGALKGMVDALHDPYSAYLGPADVAELETQLRGTLTGIGARLGTTAGRVIVEAPLPNSPALKAGVRPGDEVLEVDGQAVAGLDLRSVVKHIVGASGTVVRLKLARRDGGEVVLDITRGPITLRTVRSLFRDEGNPREWMIDSDHKVGYAQVEQFGPATGRELREALQALQSQGMKGLILDLRSCPGGMLDGAVEVANLFLAGGTIVSIRRRDGAEVVMKAEPGKSMGDFPLVVLINEQTASSAEIVAGALQDRDRAVLVGTRTVGKGSVQTIIKLKDGGGAIKLTTAYYNLPGGRNIDRTEGKPTWGIDPNEGDFVAMDHRQLEALIKRRRDRDLAGTERAVPKKEGPGAGVGSIEADDPQLAAALKAMVARLTTGQFANVGQSRSALAAHLQRLEEIRKRRAGLLQDLEKLDRELDDLNKAEPRPVPAGAKG